MKMSRQYCAINESNLAVMGIYDDVYNMYKNIHSRYSSMLNHAPLTFSYVCREEKKCIKYAKTDINDFLSRHTAFFTDKYPKLHVDIHDMGSFRFLQSSWKDLTVSYSLSNFHTFLSLLFNVINRCISRYNYEQHPASADDSTTSLAQYIDRLANQFRKMRVSASISDTADAPVDTDDIYVFSSLSLISCNQKNHVVQPREFIAHKINGTGCIELPIHQCTTCGKRFIGKQTLLVYQKEFGRFFISSKTDSSNNITFDNWRLESRLHATGYNVVEGDLSEKERQDLLTFLLDHNIMSYFEICKDIESAIATHSILDRYDQAVEK